ncbi:MAG: EF-hand domain-containing protein [Rhodobacteraceae bacterium]|nr:EF-hand domain-containing protein [Paracoccaceae bacterium]
MRKVVLSLAAMSALASPAWAVDVKDVDGNGSYSMEELKAAYPDLTEEIFKKVDTNADGSVSAEELKAAQDAGTLKA